MTALPRVFFYHSASDKLAAACALLSKACAQGKAVTVYSRSNALLDTLDQLLWTQQPTSFVPHCRADSPLATETPILLTSELTTGLAAERLMNLDTETPFAFERFPTLIEVVGMDDEDRLPARQRFRTYKEKGCEIQSIDLSQQRKETTE